MGLLDVLLKATSSLESPLTLTTLKHRHGLLFAAGPAGLRAIRIGALRDGQLKAFLEWIASPPAPLHGLLRAGLGQLWFLTLHRGVMLWARQSDRSKASPAGRSSGDAGRGSVAAVQATGLARPGGSDAASAGAAGLRAWVVGEGLRNPPKRGRCPPEEIGWRKGTTTGSYPPIGPVDQQNLQTASPWRFRREIWQVQGVVVGLALGVVIGRLSVRRLD
jgi:hypothetical protein